MTWIDGGDCRYSKLYREVLNETGHYLVCEVQTAQPATRDPFDRMEANGVEPWPEGEANFRVILAAPELAATLHELLWEMVRLSDLINRRDPLVMDAIEHCALETDRLPACRRARELLARLEMTGPPLKGGERKC